MRKNPYLCVLKLKRSFSIGHLRSGAESPYYTAKNYTIYY